MPLTAAGMRTLMRQMQEVQEHPVDGVQVRPADSMSEYHFDLDGPEGTPFAAGRFHVALIFDEQYPEVPPKGFFRTKIFHPNISERGDICVNALKRDWAPTLGLRHILVVIRCLLIEPNPESALNEEAGRLILEEYAAYERKAAMYTTINAARPNGVPRFTLPEVQAEKASSLVTADASAPVAGESGASSTTAAASASSMANGSTPSTATRRLTLSEANCHPGAATAAEKAEKSKKKALRRI
ncbi:putative ubiquitin-conjugating enzyme [Leishmania infantum JPCM5]|uniref:E2 ubiquitin-conjugating enzyme n=2 Tax=Leishmania infantum TaxID=5671 RepID=A0A6L0XZ15_LEIIN|nr:putative ubiquitin-conjugating enzyme [Leishmania infantum JPCM5]CAC9534241.1 ubiquitin-conjugating_enzyme_-_putative [Leishmania infantum]CAM71420.1 putative ubiquitin-conjugating enzyme [Leishmania infantum JPCM5]SUZ45302.1 ubiquitin-conjugating_enzyme_-_putative [Leishmania infantum]|eukprot:XP_001468336.1 putative ubiquitin-conjugating enzyme [Leishmania infantum JPCM5]